MASRRTLMKFSAGAAGLACSLLASCAATPTDTSRADAPVDPAARAAERAAIARTDPLSQATYWTQEYDANPTDADTALAFARSLRAIGSHDRALQVLADALALHPDNTDMLLVAARALISLERYPEAEATYQRLLAVTPQNADAWAGLGLVYDQTGRHKAAQSAYEQALAIAPDRPSTLSNYAMSLALAGDPAAAEALLRRALEIPGASPVVRQNLALIVGLQGRLEEMRTIAGQDLPDELANANAEVIRQMLMPQRDYEALAEGG